MVLYFRRLNELTIDDVIPLPNISEILDKSGSSNYISTLDLESEYNQISLHEKDRAKMRLVLIKTIFNSLMFPLE